MTIPGTTIYLEESECEALAVIQARYGLATLDDAFLFAIYTLASGGSGAGLTSVRSEEHPWLSSFDSSADKEAENGKAIQAEIALSTKAELQQSHEKLAQAQYELQMTNRDLVRMSQDYHSLAQELHDKQNEAAERQPAEGVGSCQGDAWSRRAKQLYQDVRDTREHAKSVVGQARILVRQCQEEGARRKAQ